MKRFLSVLLAALLLLVAKPVRAEGTDIYSEAFGFRLQLPVSDWLVRENDSGVCVMRDAQSPFPMLQFLSLPIEEQLTVDHMDDVADRFLTGYARSFGFKTPYNAADAVHSEYAVGGVPGRRTTFSSSYGQYDPVLDVTAIHFITVDCIDWYTQGRVYIALTLSYTADHVEASALMDAALLTFEALPQQAASDGTLYYCLALTTENETVDAAHFSSALHMDPTSIYLLLRRDGTGHIQFLSEANGMELTWTEEALAMDGESVPYTRQGDHILLIMNAGESIEFAPAAEVEALLAGKDAPEPPLSRKPPLPWSCTSP